MYWGNVNTSIFRAEEEAKQSTSIEAIATQLAYSSTLMVEAICSSEMTVSL
jgi:hypothetical protein